MKENLLTADTKVPETLKASSEEVVVVWPAEVVIFVEAVKSKYLSPLVIFPPLTLKA